MQNRPSPKAGRTASLYLCLLALAVYATHPQAVFSQALWTGDGLSDAWSDAANWSGGTPAPGGTLALAFGGSSRLASVNDLASFTAQGITFNSGAGEFILSGNALTLGGDVVNSSGVLQTLQLNLLLNASRLLNAGTGGLTVSGQISGAFGLTKSGNGTLTLGGANDFTGQFSTGSAGLVVATHNQAFGTSEGGVLVSAGAAIMLDGVTITGETLTLNGPGLSDNSGALRVRNTNGEWAGPVILGSGTGGGTGAGAGARLGTLGSGDLTLSGNITDNGGGFDLAIRSGSGASGKIILSGTGNSYRHTFLVVGRLALGADNALSTGNLTMGNSSNQGVALLDLAGFDQEVATLSTASTAGTTVMTQTITNSNNDEQSTLTVRNSSSANFGTTTTNGAITGNLALVKEGSGTLTLSGINSSSYTGQTRINAGAVVITKNSGLGNTGSGAAASGTLVASGAALILQNNIAVGAEALTLAGSGISNAGALRNQNGDNTWGGAITLAANTEIQADSGSSLTLDVATGNAIAGQFNLTLDAQGNLTILDPVATGTGTLTKNGAGILTLGGAGANTYTGLSTINAGTLKLAKTAGVNAIAGALTLNGTAVVEWEADHQIANGGLLTLADTSVARLLSHTETVAGLAGSGTVENEAAGEGVLAVTFATGTTHTFSGSLRDGDGSGTDGSLGFTKQGTGTQVLSGTNSHSGQTTVEAGVLQILNDSALGSTAGGTVVTGGTLELANGRLILGEALTINGQGAGNNGALRARGSSPSTWNGTVTIGSGTGTGGTRLGAVGGSTLYLAGNLVDGGGDSNGRFDIAIRTDNNINSKVVLAGPANDYGNTFIVVGTLAIDGGDDRLPVQTVLTLGNTSSTDFAIFDLNGHNQTVGGLAELGNMDKIITNSQGGQPSILTVNNNTAYSFGTLSATTPKTGAILSGNLGLTKTGTGTLTLGKSNPYTGPTRIVEGTLALSGAGAFDSTSWLDIQGGILNLASLPGDTYELTPSGAEVPVSGRGSVTGHLNLGGSAVLRPGTSSILSNPATAGDGFGTLSVQGDLTLQTISGGLEYRALFTLHGATGLTADASILPDTGLLEGSFGNHDALDVSGELSLDAGSVLRVVFGDGYQPSGGEVFNLLDWGNLNRNANGSGAIFTLADLDLDDAVLPEGLSWNTDYFLEHGILVVVPEPSRILLLFLAGTGALSRRRRIG